MDVASHYPEAIPLKQHTAEEVANALAQIFSRYGFPEEILSDQGTEFTSELMQHFVYQFDITQIRCSPYHAETNESCERFHRTLKYMIRSMVEDFNGSWVNIFHGLFSRIVKYQWKPLVSVLLNYYMVTQFEVHALYFVPHGYKVHLRFLELSKVYSNTCFKCASALLVAPS